MTRTRSQVGRYAKAVGDTHEQWVEAQHEMAKLLGILAHVHHNEPKVKLYEGRLNYDKMSVADYTGVLCGAGARTLATEAKSTADGRFPRSDVTQLQQEHLEAVAREKGLALLVLEFRAQVSAPGTMAWHTVKHRFAIPWLEVPWRVARSAEAVYLADLVSSDWRVHPVCYLSRWHAGGPPSARVRPPHPAE